MLKKPSDSKKYWAVKKLCSKECESVFRSGKPFINKVPMTQEIKDKISATKKGANLGEFSPRWKGGKISLQCKQCSTAFKVDPCEKGAKFCSRKCCDKNKDKGKTKRNERVRKSLAYKNWRISVFERDNYKCVECGNAGYLHADHIKPFALHPKLQLDINNGRTLCIDCHKKTDTFGRTGVFRKLKTA